MRVMTSSESETDSSNSESTLTSDSSSSSDDSHIRPLQLPSSAAAAARFSFPYLRPVVTAASRRRARKPTYEGSLPAWVTQYSTLVSTFGAGSQEISCKRICTSSSSKGEVQNGDQQVWSYSGRHYLYCHIGTGSTTSTSRNTPRWNKPAAAVLAAHRILDGRQ